MSRVAVTFEPTPEMRSAIDETLSGLAAVTYVAAMTGERRREAIVSADAILSWGIGVELTRDELRGLPAVRLIQLISAGVNHVPFDDLSPSIGIAANAGGWADAVAEYVLAMTLALARRLLQNHTDLARGQLNRRTPGRELRGAVVGIVGYGGIGRASARLFGAFGAPIHAIGRTPPTDESLEWSASLDKLDELLATADIIVLALPLTKATRGLIGRRELARTKGDAILVNVARAEIIDEDALYQHLLTTPSFSAGLDVWWREGGRAAFNPRHPYLSLPNLIGSPHVSANTVRSPANAARHAAENLARFLRGDAVAHLIDRSEYADEQ